MQVLTKAEFKKIFDNMEEIEKRQLDNEVIVVASKDAKLLLEYVIKQQSALARHVDSRQEKLRQLYKVKSLGDAVFSKLEESDRAEVSRLEAEVRAYSSIKQSHEAIIYTQNFCKTYSIGLFTRKLFTRKISAKLIQSKEINSMPQDS